MSKSTGCSCGEAVGGELMAARRLCMLVHSYFPEDPRVRREALAAQSAGYEVDVVCLTKEGEARRDSFEGLTIHRLPVKRHRAGGRFVHVAEYLAFFLLASVKLSSLYARKRYSLIHVHNLPDFLVFAALVPRLFGAVVWLDLHELTPELYQTKFNLNPGHRLISALRRVERVSIRFAHHVLVTSEPFRNCLLARGIPADKLTVVINSPDIDGDTIARHLPARQSAAFRPFRLVYHGTLADRYGLDEAIYAVAGLRDKIPHIVLEIYGRGDAEERLRSLVASLNLEDHVRFLGYREMSELIGLIAGADVGVVPLRATDHTELALPTKLFDYVLLNVPAVVSRTKPVAELFSEAAVAYFEPGSTAGMAVRIIELYQDPAAARAMAEAAAAEYLKYDWRTVKRTYVDLLPAA